MYRSKWPLMIVLTLAFVFFSLPAFAIQATFAGGDGTSDNPYLIKTADQLYAIRNDLDAHYFLCNNLDLSSVRSWVPIGTKTNPFTGNFNGGSHIISGLTIDMSLSDSDFVEQNMNIGFFGNTLSASITDIGFEDASYRVTVGDVSHTVFSNVGGIAGTLDRTTIERCHFEGTISNRVGTSVYARSGGIAAIAMQSSITNSYVNSLIEVDALEMNTMAAGIVAWLDHTTVDKCYVAGNVIGKNETSWCYVGGIHASSNASEQWGQIVGYGGTVKNSVVILNSLLVNGSTVYKSDIGYGSDQQRCLVFSPEDEEATQQDTYEKLGWDFSEVWDIDGSYPLLPVSIEMSNTSNRIQLYNQHDEKWKKVLYGRDSIDKSKMNNLYGAGCGVFALAHAAQWLGLEESDTVQTLPKDLAIYLDKNKKYTYLNLGACIDLLVKKYSDSYLLRGSSYCNACSLETILEHEGAAIIHYPEHFAVAVDIDSANKKVLVYDSWTRIANEEAKVTAYRTNKETGEYYKVTNWEKQISCDGTKWGGGSYWIDYDTATKYSTGSTKDADKTFILRRAAQENEYSYLIHKHGENHFAELIRYTGQKELVSIPSTLGGYPVQVISSGAFEDNNKLTTVIVPNTVNEIKSKAFSGCTSLSHVVLGKQIKTLSKDAFSKCPLSKVLCLGDAVNPIANAVKNSNRTSAFTIIYQKNTKNWSTPKWNGLSAYPLETVVQNAIDAITPFRMITINCPVDVSFFDKDGNLLAAIKNENVQNTSGSTVAASIDKDGQKVFVFPVDQAYQITITAREKTVVNINIAEYNAGIPYCTRNVNFFNIPLESGEPLSGTLPSYPDNEILEGTPEGSSVSYTITRENGNSIPYSSDKRGEDALASYRFVGITASNGNNQAVSGAGVHLYGQFAQVTVLEDIDHFIGWYQDEHLISTEKSYRFCVTKDTELTARFTEEIALPQTGDNSHLFLWISLILLSGTAIVILKHKYVRIR